MMFGLITEFHVHAAQRAAFEAILVAAVPGLDGCLSYVVAADVSRDDAVWVTEVWRDQASHAASLATPAVRTAIDRARPMMTGMGVRVQTQPANEP